MPDAEVIQIPTIHNEVDSESESEERVNGLTFAEWRHELAEKLSRTQ